MPQYKGLKMEHFWALVDSDAHVLIYFPDPKDRNKIPRDWLCSMVSCHVFITFVAELH